MSSLSRRRCLLYVGPAQCPLSAILQARRTLHISVCSQPTRAHNMLTSSGNEGTSRSFQDKMQPTAAVGIPPFQRQRRGPLSKQAREASSSIVLANTTGVCVSAVILLPESFPSARQIYPVPLLAARHAASNLNGASLKETSCGHRKNTRRLLAASAMCLKG